MKNEEEKNRNSAKPILPVNERYYFKTRGQEPDVECTERCMFKNN
jgi:hypothetical protein